MGYKCGCGVVGYKMDVFGKFIFIIMGDKVVSGRERLLVGCLG